MENLNLTSLLTDIQTLTSELSRFEDKYDVLTEAFYEWYEAGNEPENDAWVMDFTEWAGLYQSRLLLVSEYQNLLQEQTTRYKNPINYHIQSHAHAVAV